MVNGGPACSLLSTLLCSLFSCKVEFWVETIERLNRSEVVGENVFHPNATDSRNPVRKETATNSSHLCSPNVPLFRHRLQSVNDFIFGFHCGTFQLPSRVRTAAWRITIASALGTRVTGSTVAAAVSRTPGSCISTGAAAAQRRRPPTRSSSSRYRQYTTAGRRMIMTPKHFSVHGPEGYFLSFKNSNCSVIFPVVLSS